MISEILEESISLEMNVGNLYRLYSEIFPVDRHFWTRLSMEEMNHAALLKSARQFLKLGKLPSASVYPDIEVLRGLNDLITSRLNEYKVEEPAPAEAYGFAQEIEATAAEKHFQDIMKGHQDDNVLKIFRKLAGADLDHAKRIESLMKERELL